VQREPYSNYSLRVTIRNLCHYRVTNPELACAALLRDAVQDHAEDIARTRKETRRPRPGIPAHPDAGPVRQLGLTFHCCSIAARIIASGRECRAPSPYAECCQSPDSCLFWD
jgi:hypothetical protein